MNALRKRPLLFVVILLIADVFLLADVTGTIRWSQLNPLFRHGTDSKGQSSDGTGASNNLPKFDANGGLTDSGVAYNAVGGFYQTLGIGGASQTQRGRLNLIQGTGCTISNSDNSGTNSSDVTITCSGGGGGTGNFHVLRNSLVQRLEALTKLWIVR